MKLNMSDRTKRVLLPISLCTYTVLLIASARITPVLYVAIINLAIIIYLLFDIFGNSSDEKGEQQ